jgi:hypothetical protein
MRTRSGSLYSNNGGEVAVGQKRKRTSAAAFGQPDVAGDCAGHGRRKRLAGGPDYLDFLPDDLVLSILSKLAASASAPSDLLSVHLTYVVRAPSLVHQSIRFPTRRRKASPSCSFGLQAFPPHPSRVSSGFEMRGRSGD